METLSYIVLLLLSLVGYSAGVTKRGGKFKDLEPQLSDILFVLIIWTAAVLSRQTIDLNKWILILIGVLISFFAGFTIQWLRTTTEGPPSEKKRRSLEEEDQPTRKNLWEKWKAFSKRMGGFQSRILLSMMFFFLIAPFAFIVKTFSDPLNLKKREEKTHWHDKKVASMDLDDYKRQF